MNTFKLICRGYTTVLYYSFVIKAFAHDLKPTMSFISDAD